MMQKIKSETIAFFTTQQREGIAKLCRDFAKYERKRRIAARIIANQKRELCALAFQVESITASHKRIFEENEKLKKQVDDLEARNEIERVTVQELNDQWFEMSGEVSALKWAFEHK